MESSRLPRFKRAAAVAPMEITKRDREIIRQVNRHRFLRSPQIVALVGGSPQQTLRRLQLLYHHGYLERPRAQIEYFRSGGSHHMAYGLGNKGAALLEREGSATPNLRTGELSRSAHSTYLEHALMVSEVMVAIELACRQSGQVRLLWGDDIPLSGEIEHPPRPFRWKIALKSGKKRGVIPDRVFALEYGAGERAFFFLEADRGTAPVLRSDLSQNSMYRKFLAYEATWLQSVHKTQFGFHRFRVLTVTKSAKRIESLVETCDRLEQGHGLFLFTDIDRFKAANPLTLSWQSGRAGETCTLLD